MVVGGVRSVVNGAGRTVVGCDRGEDPYGVQRGRKRGETAGGG
jgi:hypothetical protein